MAQAQKEYEQAARDLKIAIHPLGNYLRFKQLEQDSAQQGETLEHILEARISEGSVSPGSDAIDRYDGFDACLFEDEAAVLPTDRTDSWFEEKTGKMRYARRFIPRNIHLLPGAISRTEADVISELRRELRETQETKTVVQSKQKTTSDGDPYTGHDYDLKREIHNLSTAAWCTNFLVLSENFSDSASEKVDRLSPEQLLHNCPLNIRTSSGETGILVTISSVNSLSQYQPKLLSIPRSQCELLDFNNEAREGSRGKRALRRLWSGFSKKSC
ncbi:hypothetical protein I302_107503 [Kwoniella bestiolae CBS 10118]|uniref:Uncharacterized protein n=1 Tax=Kwoniella bestiolae CBS 10118 TaxID=1296100 RepID=A0A1B9FYD7_9TREE|nr:hypothetical protein I302_06756 [Kwoniella bestiolae CBS 10118]OCF23772.1 hypothetical protein I302_06756 [Kwoniella bestiolae CBS 10118]